MAIRPDQQFPSQTEAPSGITPDYPYGKAQDIQTAGDGTGTPWKAVLINDIFGFFQALLKDASIVPSNNPDTANASQYLDAVKAIAGSNFDTKFATKLASDINFAGDVSLINNKLIFGISSLKDYIEFDEVTNEFRFYENNEINNSKLVAGELLIRSTFGADVLQLIDEGATSEINAQLYQEWLYAFTVGGAQTRLGLFGYTSPNNNNLILQNQTSNGAVAVISDNNDVRLLANNNVVLTGQNLTFNGNTVPAEEIVNFTPTFNGAPNASTRYGKAIKIGNKVDVYIRVSGTAAQRASLASNVNLQFGNIPWISDLSSEQNSFVTVLERYGSYFYENVGQSRAGLASAASDVIFLWHENESIRNIKTVGNWAGGDFYFNLHASFIIN